MNALTRRITIAGPVGPVEVAIDALSEDMPARGLALVAHPHPLFGGTLDNKVTQTLARAFVQLGYVVARPNFRGVGGTAGTHDEGRGEVDDLLAVIDALHIEQAPGEVVLAGFSFGSFVQTHVAERLAQRGTPVYKMALVAPAVTRWNALAVQPGTLIIHGERDDTVPLSAVLDWARPQELPVVVVPGADHFFHRRLTLIKGLVLGAWLGERAASQDAGEAGE